MGDKAIYLVAKSGKPKEVLEAWREQYFDGLHAVSVFCAEIGADRRFGFGLGKPSGFGFPKNQAPEGWLKPGRNGHTRPRSANKEMLARIDALPWPEPIDAVVHRELGLPGGMSYEQNGSTGHRWFSVDSLSPAGLAWQPAPEGGPGDVILVVRDYADAADGTNVTAWLPEGTSPEIPEGFEKLTKAEYDLYVAQATVDRERRLAAEKETQQPTADEPGF